MLTYTVLQSLSARIIPSLEILDSKLVGIPTPRNGEALSKLDLLFLISMASRCCSSLEYRLLLQGARASQT